MISSVRGTEDVLDLTLTTFILNRASSYFEQNNFSQISTPILEHSKLFFHSLGQQTDVVSKEMYVFDAADKEDSICLRPEATAAVIRACHENRIDRFPWKVFSYGPMFRKERPQKGRLRQFHQINLEIVGSLSTAQDAHFIKMLDTFFTDKLIIENYVLKLNFLGCFDDRTKYRAYLVAFLDTIKDQLCQNCLQRKDTNPLRVFDCKNETCKALYVHAPKLTDHLCVACNEEWLQLRDLLQLLSVNFIVDNSLVRGLDYYQKTVFEFTSKELGAQNAFCGGGRYSLGKEVGARNNYECIGAALGMERLIMLLELNKAKLPLPQSPALLVIMPIKKEQDPLALLLNETLQRQGLCTEILYEKASVSNMMKKANRLGAKYVLTLGEDEQQNGTVTVKNMQSGETTSIKQTGVADYFK
jgi:histidyl-tRNA synthetase